jgi:hypothetical protein
MNSVDAKALVRRWVAGIWTDGDLTLIDELAAPDYTYEAPGLAGIDRSAFREHVRPCARRFPTTGRRFRIRLPKAAPW